MKGLQILLKMIERLLLINNKKVIIKSTLKNEYLLNLEISKVKLAQPLTISKI